MKDNKEFTMKESIVYPAGDDFVEVEVLNNNIRILDENKAEKIHKHSEYITSQILQDNLNGIAKEKSEYSIENMVQSLSTEINNIKNEIIKLKENNTNWQNLPNINFKQTFQPTSANQGKNYRSIFEVHGKGTLIQAIQQTDFNVATTNACIKIEIDGSVILNIEKTHTVSESKYRYFNYLGLINGQNLKVFNDSNYELLAVHNINFIGPGFSSDNIKPLRRALISPSLEKTFEFNSSFKSFIRDSNIQSDNSVSSGKILNLAGVKFNKSFKVSTYFNHNHTNDNLSLVVYTIYSIDS